MEVIIGLLFSLMAVGSALFAASCLRKLKHEQKRASVIDPKYAPVEAAENATKTIKNEYASLKRAYESDLESLKQTEKKQSLFELGIGTTDETLYEPTKESATVTTLQDELATVRDQIKGLRKRKQACQCEFGDDVVVNGRKAAARKLLNREVRLRLRCLDNEFKMANAVIDWNNVNRLIERCEMAFRDINANGKIAKTYLRRPYLDLKLRELILQFEIKNLKAKLKEEEREQRQIEREAELAEARLKADAAKAKADREKMESLVQRELAKIESASPDQLALIEKHKEQLAQLRLKEARATSMAQLTRSGYVYVISNELSFGLGVCKIGMTRRLDPNIRVRELGDASVPELFDVHAFAFTDDAPTLEKFLHDAFEKERINLINRRKEFFRVDWQSVVSKVKSFGGTIELQELSKS